MSLNFVNKCFYQLICRNCPTDCWCTMKTAFHNKFVQGFIRLRFITSLNKYCGLLTKAVINGKSDKSILH